MGAPPAVQWAAGEGVPEAYLTLVKPHVEVCSYSYCCRVEAMRAPVERWRRAPWQQGCRLAGPRASRRRWRDCPHRRCSQSFDWFVGEGMRMVFEALKPVSVKHPLTGRTHSLWLENPSLQKPLVRSAY